MAYEVLVVSSDPSPHARHVAGFFKSDIIPLVNQVSDQIKARQYRALIFDQPQGLELPSCEQLIKGGYLKGIPLVVLAAKLTTEDKLKGLEIGCDDLIDDQTPLEDVTARIMRSIFHSIATSQLNQRLSAATETVRNALVDNSDLGANIQFLLKIHECNNLDELGQQFFATSARYNLLCSLQLRSAMGVKDMEANGMAKHLEAQLLMQLKDNGRFLDFGKRTIINFDRVSLLIKNMPIEDADKYGAIKDNIFYLIQGINSRVIALEDKCKLTQEREVLRKLSEDVQLVVGAIKESYQEVMKKIVNEVEKSAERIEDRVPHFALTELDEQFIYKSNATLVNNTNNIFIDGLKVDELFGRLESAMKTTLKSIQD